MVSLAGPHSCGAGSSPRALPWAPKSGDPGGPRGTPLPAGGPCCSLRGGPGGGGATAPPRRAWGLGALCWQPSAAGRERGPLVRVPAPLPAEREEAPLPTEEGEGGPAAPPPSCPHSPPCPVATELVLRYCSQPNQSFWNNL